MDEQHEPSVTDEEVLEVLAAADRDPNPAEEQEGRLTNERTQRLHDIEVLYSNLRQARADLAVLKVTFYAIRAGVSIEGAHLERVQRDIRDKRLLVDTLVALIVQQEADGDGLGLPEPNLEPPPRLEVARTLPRQRKGRRP